MTTHEQRDRLRELIARIKVLQGDIAGKIYTQEPMDQAIDELLGQVDVIQALLDDAEVDG